MTVLIFLTKYLQILSLGLFDVKYAVTIIPTNCIAVRIIFAFHFDLSFAILSIFTFVYAFSRVKSILLEFLVAP